MSPNVQWLRHPVRKVHAELMLRQPLLTGFAWLMLALMLPTLVLYGLDDRICRGVAIWAKPLKFMAAAALFSATTAWFVGLLPEPIRRTRAVIGLAWTVMLTSSFEVGYISLQAALGDGPHHNVGDIAVPLARCLRHRGTRSNQLSVCSSALSQDAGTQKMFSMGSGLCNKNPWA